MRPDKNQSKKKSLLDRFIDLTWKDPAKAPQQQRPKSPAPKLNYVLPGSFIRAVDEARLKNGEDILPRFHQHSELSKRKRVVSSLQVTKPTDNHIRKAVRSTHPSKEQKNVHSPSPVQQSKTTSKHWFTLWPDMSDIFLNLINDQKNFIVKFDQYCQVHWRTIRNKDRWTNIFCHSSTLFPPHPLNTDVVYLCWSFHSSFVLG